MIPQIQITNAGYVAPTREEITAGLWELMRSAFGDDITQDARTPQGQLVTSLTAAFYDKDSQFIALANNFDPRYSSGKFQEGLGAIYFLKRKSPTQSIVEVEFVGLGGAVIPAETQLQDGNGNTWETTAEGVIDSVTGKGQLFARCLTSGPVAAAIGTVNKMISALDGVDRVENTAPAILGRAEESRSDYEERRVESVSANGQLTASSVKGAVLGLDGVIDVYAVQNPSDESITVGVTNYPMIRNSLLVSVVGGDDYDIAGEIMKKGGTGCSFAGNTDVVWRDTDNFDDGPPEYNVTFLRPDIVPLYFKVGVSEYSKVTAPQISAIRSSIVNQLKSGGSRARIGGVVVPSSFSCDLSKEMGVVEVKVSTDNVEWKSLIEFGVDQIPSTDTSMIKVEQYVPID